MGKWELVTGMQLFFENWRAYLSEGTGITPFQLYVDLDGVLVDFQRGATEAINIDLKAPESVPERLKKRYDKMARALEELGRDPQNQEDWKITAEDFDKKSPNRINAVRNYMYPRLQDDLQFWSELNWIEPDGRVLWELVKDVEPPPVILTSPMHGQASHEGKELWVQNEENLGLPLERVIVERDKFKYAVDDSGTPNVLIDDTPEKIALWEQAGGIGILHTSMTDTLRELAGLGVGAEPPEETPE
jgi:phosphoglycolate phosphatase-like HAD superfamily hydrolase